MKKFPVIILTILLFAGCTKKDPGTTFYTTNNYRLFIKNNRIIETDYLVNDTVSGRTKYYFTDTLVKVVSYGWDTSKQENYVLFKIGKNSYAESSIQYPESFTILDADTLYMGRKYYTYNSQNQLITIECEHFNPYIRGLLTLYTYTYSGENIAGYYSHNPHYTCQFQITYEPSDISSKIDILNFTNGILGKTSTKLVKHIKNVSSGFCNPHSSATIEYDITYTLDNHGYVIQSRKSTNDQSDNRYQDNRITNTTINNYDIRLLD
jgi:hypothetical protein